MDVSNYTDAIPPDALARWVTSGITKVIVQAIIPPAGFPPSVTRQQIEACKAAGLDVEAYVYLWTADPDDIARHLALLDDLGVSFVWLDCEDTTAASVTQRQAAIRRGLKIITDSGFSTGIYTGRWWWTAYLGDPQDHGLLSLWLSDYDNHATLDPATPGFGGFTEVTMKQWVGSTSLDGIGGVDLNVY